MGLEKLVDVLLQFIDLFRFWSVTDEGYRTIIFTLGRPTRVLCPGAGWFHTGLYLKAPLGIEHEHEIDVKDEKATFANQSISTSDGKKVHVHTSFTYSIDPEQVITWQTTLGSEDHALSAGLRAAVAETIIRHKLEELLDPDDLRSLRREIIDRGRKELGGYGYLIKDFKWIDRVETRTYRLVTGE